MDSQKYRRRWQRAAFEALGEFLAADLPAVSWTLSVSGALVGTVDSLMTAPVSEQRAVFEAWARHLNAKVSPERADSSGVVHLYGQFSGKGGVLGAIRATLYPPLDGDA
ncbi:hypothetical protein AB0E62_34245 [Streptomyces sp. NPDC038707]|uniref:hypothetical protein n=1 Tax=Streptomyces sp. NPDC038707 TaxID=3154329 RepID=UPI0033F6B455